MTLSKINGDVLKVKVPYEQLKPHMSSDIHKNIPQSEKPEVGEKAEVAEKAEVGEKAQDSGIAEIVIVSEHKKRQRKGLLVY